LIGRIDFRNARIALILRCVVVRLRLALGLVAAATLVVAAPARAEPAAALLSGNNLLLFDTSTPTTTTAVPVTGLGVNETLAGIDQRPATLGLYGVTVTTGSASNSIVRTYAIDPASGQATLIGATTPLLGAGDVATGLDFNPTVDRIRYVNVNNENARMNPNKRHALWRRHQPHPARHGDHRRGL
jgi:hypothetical protein